MANTTSELQRSIKLLLLMKLVEEAFERIGLQNVAGYQLKICKTIS